MVLNVRKSFATISKISLSLLLGGLILFWMYRGFNLSDIADVLGNGVDWTWMFLSFPFGIMAQVFRGWRWHLTLNPLGERPRRSVSVNSIFLSYALSLAVPRIGEFARCGVLSRWDGVSFPKALGTVVAERAVDSLLVAAIAVLTLLWQVNVFDTFFMRTGTSIEGILRGFSSAGYLVTAVCAAAALLLAWVLLRRLAIYQKVRDAVGGVWQGVMSLRIVGNKPLFAFYTLGIWLCYFLHYYLTFFCFESTAGLGMSCALVTFIVGSIAVLVPTPNGAGPWHFAVKTMLILYGVTDNDALYFVLIVHSVQTLLVVLLGVYAWLMLSFTGKRAPNTDGAHKQDTL